MGLKEVLQSLIAMKQNVSRYRCNDLTIITLNQEDSVSDKGRQIKVIPAWKWMQE